MTFQERITTVAFETQAYQSRIYGDQRIDCYISIPSAGVSPTTGLLLMLHGRGTNGQLSLETESLLLADRFDLVVTRVEYRQSGREAVDGKFDKPYDYSKFQAIDCLRAAWATLELHPAIDRRRIVVWGGSQGGHIGGLCLVYAPDLFAAAMLCSGPARLLRASQLPAEGFAWDLRSHPGRTLWEITRDEDDWDAPAHEFEIRDLIRLAPRFPDDVPVAMIHGTHDDIVDIRHAVELVARLRAHGKIADLHPIYRGIHLLTGAEADDEATRVNASLKYAGSLFAHCRNTPGVWPQETVFPVTGGSYRVFMEHSGPALEFLAKEPT